MKTRLMVLLGCSAIVGCDPAGHRASNVSLPPQSASSEAVRDEGVPLEVAKPEAKRDVSSSAKAAEPDKPKVKETLEGAFRGSGTKSRILFLENTHIVHTWSEAGVEKSEPITKRYPPGHRECKVLRSHESQDFLVCMYWYTGPGGGRVDGILFDLKRSTRGEFFSSAINIGLLVTLCYPETAAGPMPSFNMVEWATIDASKDEPAKITARVQREGWSTKEAAALRSQKRSQKYCKCAGAEECADEPKPPEKDLKVTYRLLSDELRPTKESKEVLKQIRAQWGHNDSLGVWNMKMRGF